VTRFVFLDRDGTLTYDVGFTHETKDYRLLPKAIEGLHKLAQLGFHFAIVTNQSGIARGLYTENDFQTFQAHLVSDLASQGIEIEASYFCPHSPEDACSCRKPQPGLFHKAARELGADLSESWMIGDRETDLRAARNAGCRGTILLLSDPSQALFGTLCARDLLEAAEQIEAYEADDASQAPSP